MTPKTQSVCKHCREEIKPCWLGHISEFCEGWLHMSNYHACEDGLHRAEPASTGEPKPLPPGVNAAIQYMTRAARPSEPSAPQTSAEPAVLCDICGVQSGIEHGHAGHTFKPPKEVAEQSAEPSASSEPEKMGTCQAQDTLHKKAGICIDWKPSAAPQPVSEADDPEHPIVGPEDGNPCCEHCAKHPGWQWALGVDQPVSGDAPKVEEIALDHAGHCVVCRRAIRCEYKHVKSGHDETCVVGKILSALRSFIPASTTPQTQTCPRCEGHCHVYDYEAMAGPAQDFSRSFDQDAYVIPCPACQGSGRINL